MDKTHEKRLGEQIELSFLNMTAHTEKRSKAEIRVDIDESIAKMGFRHG